MIKPCRDLVIVVCLVSLKLRKSFPVPMGCSVDRTFNFLDGSVGDSHGPLNGQKEACTSRLSRGKIFKLNQPEPSTW